MATRQTVPRGSSASAPATAACAAKGCGGAQTRRGLCGPHGVFGFEGLKVKGAGHGEKSTMDTVKGMDVAKGS